MKNQKRVKKEKFNPIMLEKCYSDFNEGLQELAELSPYIEDLLGDKIETITEKECKKIITDDFTSHLPEYGNKETQFYSLMCTFNRISYKLPTYTTIGWTIMVDKDTNEISYKFAFSILSNKLKEQIYDAMINNDWKVAVR